MLGETDRADEILAHAAEVAIEVRALPAAAIAIWRAARPEQRVKVGCGERLVADDRSLEHLESEPGQVVQGSRGRGSSR